MKRLENHRKLRQLKAKLKLLKKSISATYFDNNFIKSLKIKLVIKNSKITPPRDKSFPAQAKFALENLLNNLEDSPLRHRLIKLIKHHTNAD